MLGRFFSDQDNSDSGQVAIIDQKFAQRFWPHNDAVGKHIWLDLKKPITIVGVVGVVKQYVLDTDGKIDVNIPTHRDASRGTFLVARCASHSPGSPLPSARRSTLSIQRPLSSGFAAWRILCMIHWRASGS